MGFEDDSDIGVPAHIAGQNAVNIFKSGSIHLDLVALRGVHDRIGPISGLRLEDVLNDGSQGDGAALIGEIDADGVLVVLLDIHLVEGALVHADGHVAT